MRKIFSVILVILLTLSINQHVTAQTAPLLPTQPEAFYKALDNYLNATKRENAKQAIDAFKPEWEARFNPEQKDAIIATANLMMERKMTAVPYFVDYVNALTNFSKSKLPPNKFKEWNNSMQAVIKNSKKGNNKNIEKYIDFSSGLFDKNALFTSAARDWVITSNYYEFAYDSVPKLLIPKTHLIAKNKADTITLYNTSGVYYPLKSNWVGDKAKVTWVNSGLDSNNVFALIEKYSVDLTKADYEVDSVTFYHKTFFPGPIKGRLVNKLVGERNEASRSYPQFESNDKNIKIDNLAKRVKFEGGVALHGSKLIGTGSKDQDAILLFQNAKDEVAVKALSKYILMKKGEELFAKDAEVTLYLGEDSIYHPGLDLQFKVGPRKMDLIRGEQGISKTTFNDSYHKMELDAEAISWPLDSNYINIEMIVGVGKQPAYFESANFFEKSRLDKFQAIADYNPVHVIKQYAEKLGTTELDADALAKRMNPNYSVNTIRRMLFTLVESGFIYYDQDKEMVTVREKTFNYVFANAELIDYDIIRLKSVYGRKTYGKVSLLNYDMELDGVSSVLLSDSQFVLLIPKNKKLTVKKNRDMTLNGKVLAGRMDFSGEGFTFLYEDFKLGLNKIDTFVINIPGMDQEGRPSLVPLKTSLHNLNGGLNIDAPDNKSGKERLHKYPIFESFKESYAYYHKKSIFNYVYPKEKFYFELTPFAIDSLDNFDPAALAFDGKLVSAGIFPEFKEVLKIQSDLSLGFITTTPEAGMKLYGGKGQYMDTIDLSNKGLRGKGTIKYLTSNTVSKKIFFFPDSLNAQSESFTVEKSPKGTEFPDVQGKNVYTHWMPYRDSMHVNMQNNVPFTMYSGQSTLFGNLILAPHGLSGNGNMEWAEAILKSKQLKFKSETFDADTASFQLKSLDPTKMAFSTPNVKAHIDFKKRIGEFKSNTDKIATEFPYNQYTTSINEFIWDMDKRVIDFKAPKLLKDSYFVSTHPNQDSLKFFGSGAHYDLNNYILDIKGVPYIYVADAQIFPDTGAVTIEPEARMRTLKNAKIEANVESRHHKIYNATLDIYGRKDYKGTGFYDYINKTKKVQQIFFDQIFVTGNKKKEGQLITNAVAKIADDKGFTLNPRIQFKGNAKLIADEKFLTFDGFAKLEHTNENLKTQWFSFASVINPDTLRIVINEPKNEAKQPLFVGMHLADSNEMYTTFLNTKRRLTDEDMFITSGFLEVNEAASEFSIGDEKKIKGESLKGNFLKFSEKTGMVVAEGQVNMGSEFGLVKLLTAGTIHNNVNENTYLFDVVMGLNFLLDPLLQEMMTKDITENTYEMPDVNYSNPAFEKAIVEFLNDKDGRRTVEDLRKAGAFKKPKEIDYTFFFTELKMLWDQKNKTYRSKGPVGLGYIGEKVVNKRLKAYIEFGKKRSGDYFNIYLQAGPEVWYYFNYAARTLQIISSNEEFNKAITQVDIKKRKEKEGTQSFVYIPGSERKAKGFLEEMQILENE